jgi:23S rRNA (cytosine1962-C5)-methyltransferase
MNKKVILKAGKEKAILNRHHWIFSGAIAEAPPDLKGDILPVYSQNGDLLGNAYFNSKAKILGRMLSFGSQDPLKAIQEHLMAALKLRLTFFDHRSTNAYRLVNGEGDFLPGLIVDRYNDALILQVSTLGMENLKESVIHFLKKQLNPSFIYEKSDLPSRKEEGLEPQEQLLDGILREEIVIMENRLQFIIRPVEGQKTGFFLDHRDMREQVRSLAKNKRVLNCFAYTGGFSLYAASGGAISVDSVDISDKAMQLAKKNAELNAFTTPMEFYSEDVFQFLRRSSLQYELVILDPPAFAKRQKDIIPACRGYKDINRIAMQKMPSESLLLTSSCSYYVDESLFQKVVFQAAAEAKREVRIIGRHRLAIDHPINIFHPEGDYLKSLLLYIV